jgi:hypothetical protein
MDNEGGAIVVKKIDDLDYSSAQAPSHYEPLLPVPFPGKPVPGVSNDRFYFRDRAPMFRCMLHVPLDPAECRWKHELYATKLLMDVEKLAKMCPFQVVEMSHRR